MPLSDLIARFIGSEPAPSVDFSADEEARRRLLTRSHHGALRRPVPVVIDEDWSEMEADAAAFVRAAGRRYGITDLGWDRISLEKIDALLDAARGFGHEAFDPQMRQRAAAWVSEWIRHVHGFRRSMAGTMTDGRVEYDPYAKIEARLISDESPTLTHSIAATVSASDDLIRNAA